jgi:hypothetical protein
VYHTARLVLISVSAIVLISTVSFANVAHFRTEIDNSEIILGGEAVVSLYAWAEDAVTGNGIVYWQLDMSLLEATGSVISVNTDGVVVYEPYTGFYTDKGANNINDPYAGAVKGLGASSYSGSSDIGVITGDANVLSNWTKMADITVTGIGTGTVNYDLNDGFLGIFSAGLADFTTILPGQYDDSISEKTITVTPEPMTLLLLAPGAVFFMRRRMHKNLK